MDRKKVLITGGAGGIGSAIVEEFVRRGYFVYIVDIDEEKSNQLILRVGSDNCAYIKMDTTNLKEVLETAQKFNDKIDHIISLAGRALEDEWHTFLDSKYETISDSIHLNLIGHLNTIKAFYEKLTKDNSSIIMVSSINAFGSYGLPIYSSAKAGLIGFMKSVAPEFGKDNVRINIISPGTIQTPATLGEPKDFEKLKKGIALNDFANSKDVAKLAYRICKDFTSITGQNFVIDAGQTTVK